MHSMPAGWARPRASGTWATGVPTRRGDGVGRPSTISRRPNSRDGPGEFGRGEEASAARRMQRWWGTWKARPIRTRSTAAAGRAGQRSRRHRPPAAVRDPPFEAVKAVSRSRDRAGDCRQPGEKRRDVVPGRWPQGSGRAEASGRSGNAGTVTRRQVRPTTVTGLGGRTVRKPRSRPAEAPGLQRGAAGAASPARAARRRNQVDPRRHPHAAGSETTRRWPGSPTWSSSISRRQSRAVERRPADECLAVDVQARAGGVPGAMAVSLAFGMLFGYLHRADPS